MRAPSLTISPKALASAVASVKVGVLRKAKIQALGGVRITASRTAQTVATGHSNIAARATIRGEAAGRIDAVVSHDDLTKALKLFSAFPELSLTVGDTDVTLTAGGRAITLRTLRVEDCSPFPETDGALVLEADGATFAESLKRAGAFAGRDESRPVLCAVLIDWHTGLQLVATDSYRLGVIALDAKRKVRKARKPEQNRLALGRKLVDAAPVLAASGSITVTSTGTHAIVHAGDVTLAVRCPDGSFPDYRKLLPAEGFPNVVTVPTAQLAAASDVAATFARRNAPARLNVNGTVRLHGHTLDVCSFEETLPDAAAAMGEKGEFEIGLNPDFLRDIVGCVQGETTTVRLHSPLRPALIEDDEDVFLLMPIRLNV